MSSTTAHIRISFLKKLLSYFSPTSLRRGKGDGNQHLELFLYHGRLQLVTNDAVYSDGDKYLPAIAAVKDLKEFLPSVKTTLMLGGGLCSMVQVMQQKGYHPHFTVVEKDKVVLQWAMELFSANDGIKIDPVCNDAQVYMQRNTAKYDLVFVDVFNGRIVPVFVCSIPFLQQCRDSIAPKGHLALNYIINDKIEWAVVKNNFAAVFPDYHVIDLGINQILIA